jgi:hypothetical protein
MKKRITLNTFRKMNRAEEALIRIMMPATSAADPLPVETPITPRVQVRTLSNGVRLVKPLTYTLAEVR